MGIAFLSLGSNFGDRLSYLQQAASMLGTLDGTNIVSSSSFYETEPWCMKTDNWFVNAVIQISTSFTPEELLDECMKIEQRLGRVRKTQTGQYGDRTIDIDILFYDDKVINTEKLILPHRYLQRRAFVLVPLLEIAQDLIHPLFGKTISQLYDELENPEQVYLYGTRV